MNSSGRAPYLQRLQSYMDRVGLQGLASPGDIKVRGLKLHEKQGLSNRTYLLNIDIKDRSAEPLILRLYTGGGKAAREFMLLKLLRSKGLPVPRVYAFEDSNRILDKPFIIMEKVEQTSPEDGQRLVEEAARSLAEIHGVKSVELRGILESRGDYPRRELEGIKLLAAALIFSTVGPPASIIRCLRYVGPLDAKLSEGRAFLIHGDYNFDNIIYSNGRAYIIDWESAEIAEPTFDVAYACNFLDFGERLEGRAEGEFSGRFLEAYLRYGGTIKELGLYRRLAALKVLLLLDVLRSRNLFSLLLGLRARFGGPEATHLIEAFRRYLFEVLEGTSSSRASLVAPKG